MPVPSAPARRGLALRVGVAATLVLGVAAALPSAAAEPVHVDDSGYVELPAPLLSSADYAFDFASCPDAPPNQGMDAWVYALPEEVAVAGAPVTVSGTDAAGEVDITAYVYDDSCTYLRYETSTAALSLVLQETDRYLAVTTGTGVGTALSLVVDAPAGGTEPTTEPTADPGTGSGGMTRGDYSGGVNDPLYPEESTGPASLEFAGQWGMRIIQAEQAWQEPQATGAGITVAVLDSGLDVNHEDFQCEGKVARLDAGRYPRFADVTDTDGHGTHVAGIVGACTDNGVGVVGTAPDSTILPVQALSPEEATAERLAAAIDAAVESGAHVINMSLGFSALGIPATGSAFGLLGAFANDIDPAIERAVQAGVVVVAAAGNESVPLCGYPAIAEKVVCVGSTDRRDLNAWYGNFPVTPSGASLVAPGGSGTVGLLFCDAASEAVLSTYSTDARACPTYPGYSSLDGTSMAAPHVAGVAALVYDRLGGERSPAAAQQVVDAMTSSAVDLYTPGYDPMSGDGRVDALGAVQAVTAAQPTDGPSDGPEQSGLVLLAADSGQTTDDLPVAARLTDDEQQRVAGEPIAFRLSGPGGTREAEATTDEDGVATAVLPLDLEPGSYTVSATHDADGRTTSAEQPVEVTRDDSTLTLTVDGRGAQRTLTVALTDEDTPERGLTGADVVLLADGREIGTVVTDDAGRATFAPEGSARGARTYEARFAGDDRYDASSATANG